jgi:hypothetical protein
MVTNTTPSSTGSAPQGLTRSNSASNLASVQVAGTLQPLGNFTMPPPSAPTPFTMAVAAVATRINATTASTATTSNVTQLAPAPVPNVSTATTAAAPTATGGQIPHSTPNRTINLAPSAPPATPGTLFSPVVQHPASLSVVVPTMGGYEAIGPYDVLVWTGGKPKATWSGLEDPNAMPFSPNCFRPTRADDMMKSYNRRTAAPTQLFKVNNDVYDFTDFSLTVKDHFQDHGLDTVMYVPSPGSSSVMVNVVEFPDQAGFEETKAHSLVLSQCFDKYDRENDRAAKCYLRASLDPDLLRKINLVSDDADTAAILWMRIVRAVCDNSVDRHQRIKEIVMKLSPLQEPGENVSLYADKVRKYCKKLEQSGHFDWSLMMHVTQALCSSSVEQFRQSYNTLRKDIDRDLQRLPFLGDLRHRDKYMRDKGYHFSTILDDAEMYYLSLKENGNWPPAKGGKDSGRAPSVFTAATTKQSPELHALIQSEVAKQRNADRKAAEAKAICHKCKQKGHYANNCPSGTTPTTPTPPASTPAVKSDKDKSPKPNWRNVPPGDGESHTKVKGEKTFHWCPKCKKSKGLWTSSHTASTHKSSEGGDKPAANCAFSPMLYQFP